MSDSANPKHRILIVEDHPLYRDGLRRFIDSQPDMACCGEAGTCRAALDAASQSHPDLVIVDLRLRDGDGTDLVRKLILQQPDIRLLVLSQKDESVYAKVCLRLGAHGYIMKEEATEELLDAIRTVLRGDRYVSNRLSALILKDFLAGTAGDGVAGKLSDRELQVFQFLGSGLGNQQIAEQLHVSVKTVETHREHIKRKLELPDAVSLVRAAREWVEAVER